MFWIWGAVDKLLERDISRHLVAMLLVLLPQGNLSMDLNRARSCHCPAGSARALLMDEVRGHEVPAPVHFCCKLLVDAPNHSRRLLAEGRPRKPPAAQTAVTQQGLELRISVICEHIHRGRPCNAFSSIVCCHQSFVPLEHLKALLVAQGILLVLILPVLLSKFLVVFDVNVFLGRLHPPISGNREVERHGRRKRSSQNCRCGEARHGKLH
mmetsp:Transcript_20437/g.48496  ORF Transcript_20437/g.48496 Transcript_20437/m.48496 type:complete len:211 (+) Transcript_20437:480-1112(+)